MTPRQSQALAFIKQFMAENQYSPSYREIAEAIGHQGQGRIRIIIGALRDAGHITFMDGQSRSIQLAKPITLCLSSVIDDYDAGRLEPRLAIERIRTITIAAEAFQ